VEDLIQLVLLQSFEQHGTESSAYFLDRLGDFEGFDQELCTMISKSVTSHFIPPPGIETPTLRTVEDALVKLLYGGKW
jgi:hypothetical protein